MSYNNYMYAVDRSDKYLAHYGIKGMKWGVRKAIERGNTRKLDRAYRKASKKLAKLEKRANNGAKYARRAARLGAGAALAGGVALQGPVGIAGSLHAFKGRHKKYSSDIQRWADAGEKSGVVKALETWGNSNSIGKGAAKIGADALQKAVSTDKGARTVNAINQTLNKHGMMDLEYQAKNLGNISNNTIARAGAAALGAGLAGAAGYNAYRAATTKRAAKKAQRWKNAMNETFKGTKYENGSTPSKSHKKRRR